MTRKMGLVVLAGAAAAVGGAVLGWSVTAIPVDSLPARVLASAPPAQAAPIRDKADEAPQPRAAEPSPAPAPAPQAEKPAPTPEATLEPSKDAKSQPKTKAKGPERAGPRIGAPGVFSLETPDTAVILDPKRGSLRFKTPFGELNLDTEKRQARLLP